VRRYDMAVGVHAWRAGDAFDGPVRHIGVGDEAGVEIDPVAHLPITPGVALGLRRGGLHRTFFRPFV
jgi:hypothetical protein